MSSLEIFADQPFTTVINGGATTPLPNTQETWVVTDSSPFPAAVLNETQFHIVDTASGFSSEIIAVIDAGTGGLGATWTVIRGVEGTTPIAHNPGFQVTQVITAGWLNNVSDTSPPDGGTAGSILYSGPASTAAWLPGNVTTAKEFLTSTGGGGTANTPAWGTIATTDVPVLNQNTSGTAANVSGIVTVPHGGLGTSSLTAYALVTGGTGSTSTAQQVSGVGGSGQVLTSQGTGQLPAWVNAGAGFANPMTTAGDMIAGTVSGTAIRVPGNVTTTKEFLTQAGNGGTANSPTWGTINASDVNGTVAVTQGGTGGTTATAYAVVTGGTAAAAPFQTVASVGTAGQGLLSNGAGSLPSFRTTVNTVTALDASIVVGGTGLAPTVGAQLTRPQVAKYSGVSGQTPRESIPFYTVSGNIGPSAGQLVLCLLPVQPGDVISNLGFLVGTTGATFGTTASSQHWWTALYDAAALTLIAQSADQGTAPLTAQTSQMLALGSPAPYTVPSNVYQLYGGVMINTGTGGATQPTVRGPAFTTATFDSTTSLFPTSRIYTATANTGLGGTAPAGPLTLTPTSVAVYFGAD